MVKRVDLNLVHRCFALRFFRISISLFVLLCWDIQFIGASNPSSSARTSSQSSPGSPTAISLNEAKQLIDLVPAVRELRSKGMDVEVEVQVQSPSSMHNKDYYFFWVHNVTALQRRDLDSISVGDYAVNKRTADVRVWQVSEEVYYGDDGVLVTGNELEQLQAKLRTVHAINSQVIQSYRPEHLAAKIVPRDLAQSAVQLPITEQLGDTAQLSCWRDSKHLISRLARGPIASSSSGYRAYAEVSAIAFQPKYQETYTGPLCENHVKLFVAKDNGATFEVVLNSDIPEQQCLNVEATKSCEINGVEIVDWSEDGHLLLANLVLWEYESDSEIMRVPVVYDTRTGQLTRPDLYQFFDKYFHVGAKQNCEFDVVTKGFSANGNLIITASRPPFNSDYDHVFCVDQNQTLLFDMQSNQITSLPSEFKPKHYAISNISSAPKPR